MRLFEIVKFNNCNEISGYLNNKINYLKKNKNDSAENNTIMQELNNEHNRHQLMICLLSSTRINKMFSELKSLLKG